jgi:hypothetical protein
MGSTAPAVFHFATAAASRHVHLLRCNPDGLLSPFLAPWATENGRKQPPHARIPVAPARFCQRAASAIARAPRHEGPTKIATQAVEDAPMRLTPTTQSSTRPIVTISHVPHRQDFACMGLPLRPLIPLIVEPAERAEDDNDLATMASPTTQRQIRRVQRQDKTNSTLSGASCEGDAVVMSPDGGDTSPPTEMSAGNSLVALQYADCCAPQTQLSSSSERDSDALASIDATPMPDNRPPLASALSGVPYLPGALAATDPRSTTSVQTMTHQSTVSGAVGAGQPAANR